MKTTHRQYKVLTDIYKKTNNYCLMFSPGDRQWKLYWNAYYNINNSSTIKYNELIFRRTFSKPIVDLKKYKYPWRYKLKKFFNKWFQVE